MQKQEISTDLSRGSVALAIGDVLALCVFLLIGEIQHGLLGSPSLLLNVLKQLAAFGVAWFVLAWALGALTIRTPLRAWSFIGRSLLAWLFAAPAAIVLRAVLMGEVTIAMPFVFAATVFGGLILLGWRMLYAVGRVLAGRRRQPVSTLTQS